MANYNQAPILKKEGEIIKQDTFFQGLPQDLISIIFNNLDGKCGNQIKLMYVLLSTGEGFRITEKWICEKTGMIQQTYNNARKKLIEKGWLRLENGCLYVLIDEIYKAGGTISNCAIEKEEIKTQFDDVPKAQYQNRPPQSQIVPPPQSHNVYKYKENYKDKEKEIKNGIQYYDRSKLTQQEIDLGF